ncbi:ABC transporter ATP-binding protein [Actinomycetaceae bacterium L2_0104]
MRQNVGYGLDDDRMPANKRDDLIDIAMANLNISSLADKDPAVLSGGQSQRVALARTLVRRPKVLLLDEPLSHVETPLRREIRRDIVAQVRRARLAAVYVTHDLEEAFLVGDRVAVMSGGRIVQDGPPEEVYRRPASRFVADLLGQKNVLAGTVLEPGPTARVLLGAREYRMPADPGIRVGAAVVVLPPEALLLEPAPAGSEILGDIGQVIESSFAGSWALAEVESDIGTLVVHEWDPDRPRTVGEYVRFSLRPGRGWVIPDQLVPSREKGTRR